MNNHRTRKSAAPVRATALVASLMLSTFTAQAAVTAKAKPANKSPAVASTPCSTTQTVPLINVPLGKSTVLKLQVPASRIIMGNPEGGRAAKPALVTGADKTAKGDEGAAQAGSSSGVADVDVVLLNPTEIYLLGKSVGSTNIIVLSRTGVCTIMDIAVGVDTKTLESRFVQFIPGSAIKATAAADSILLTGLIADATQVDQAMSIASAYAGSKVINMLSIADPQQVMLEVKVAEVSKKLVEKLGAKVNLPKFNGSWTYTILSDFLNGSPGVLKGANAAGTKLIEIDAEKRDGLVKILAEPTIMAISGQEGSFLAGGTILIPTSSTLDAAGRAIPDLEEKDFGVSLKFTPTVLADGRINLRVKPEVSEVSPEGISISGGIDGVSRSVLPLIFVRRAETTVQLRDGQSFAIGGLVKNNVVQGMKAFPILGELPILGALFRSADFENEKSELVFIITPRLVKPLPPDYRLPTDSYIEPSRAEVFLGGKMEGTPPPAETQNPPSTSGDTPPVANPPAASGFELK